MSFRGGLTRGLSHLAGGTQRLRRGEEAEERPEEDSRPAGRRPAASVHRRQPGNESERQPRADRASALSGTLTCGDPGLGPM